MLALECDLALAADIDGPSAPGLRRIRRRADQLIRSVATLAEGIRPVTVTECLERAGRNLGAAGIDLRLDVAEDTVGLPAEIDALLGCVIREGVTNLLRHAPAATVCEITVRAAESVTVVIRNDGDYPAGPVRPGAGIAGLRDRAVRLGGRIDITSSAGWFAVRACVPARRPGPRAAALSLAGRS